MNVSLAPPGGKPAKKSIFGCATGVTLMNERAMAFGLFVAAACPLMNTSPRGRGGAHVVQRDPRRVNDVDAAERHGLPRHGLRREVALVRAARVQRLDDQRRRLGEPRPQQRERRQLVALVVVRLNRSLPTASSSCDQPHELP